MIYSTVSFFSKKLFLVIVLFILLAPLKAQVSFIHQVLEEQPTSTTSNKEVATIRSRLVTINDVTTATTIQLPLFEDVHIIANRTAIDRHKNGAVVWRGAILNQQWGYVLISSFKGAYWAKVQLDDGSIFLLNPVANERHYLLKQVLNLAEEDKDCAGEVAPISKPEEPTTIPTERLAADICAAADVCTGKVVDIMVLYTEATKTVLGGALATEMAIAAAVSEMNTINANSQVAHTFNLVHVAAVNYTEIDTQTDLGHLDNPTDGQLDYIHDLRDQYYADVVSLIISSGSGLANLNTDAIKYKSSLAFSVVGQSYMLTTQSLAHEVGHNMGLRHDRHAYSSTSIPITCDWAWGFVNPSANGGTTSQKWRTTMAYNKQCRDWGTTCIRVPHWSNPDVNYNNEPTGVANDQTNPSNNSYLLNRSICEVEKFRTAPTCTDCTISIACATYNEATASGPNNTTPLTITENLPALPANTSLDICVTTMGDNSSSGEVFYILDENGIILGQTAYGNEDCTIPNRVCLTITATDFNNWRSDGTISFQLIPFNTGTINPTACNANRACVEILFPTVYSNCPTTHVIVDTPTTDQTYAAATTIRSTSIINAPLQIRYEAAQSISLEPGFHAKAGATFSAIIKDCEMATIKETNVSIEQQRQVPATAVMETSIDWHISPNPIAHWATFSFSLPSAATAQIDLYDLRGQLVQPILSKTRYQIGHYQLTWQREQLPSGIYFINFKTDKEQLVKKVIIE